MPAFRSQLPVNIAGDLPSFFVGDTRPADVMNDISGQPGLFHLQNKKQRPEEDWLQSSSLQSGRPLTFFRHR